MIRPLIEEIPDPPCPIDIFNSTCKEPRNFFMDGECDNPGLAAHSMLGWDPFLVFRSKGERIRMEWKGGPVDERTGNPFDLLEELFKKYTLADNGIGLPFAGGAVGYFAYDMKGFIERLPDTAKDDIGIPDCILGFYDAAVVCDNAAGRSFIVSSGLPETGAPGLRRRQVSRLEEFKGILSRARRAAPPVKDMKEPRVRSNFSRDSYITAIGKAKEYIKKGDIYQVNISQTFTADITVEPAELYKRLRKASPAPFSSYLDFGEVAIASSSPERFLKRKGDHIETRPIKGTRPRGEDGTADTLLRNELVESAKDHAEHIMIVDLERNDLGRVCDYGTVRLVENAVVEEYPNVFHLVSTVAGNLKKGISSLQALRAAFPGGSITGAPKIRSMEIIDELEPAKRSVYTGAIGYISFDGNMDTAIAIRTLIIKGNKAYFSVGGGIVADSDPESEYEETLHKAQGMMDALGVRAGATVRVK